MSTCLHVKEGLWSSYTDYSPKHQKLHLQPPSGSVDLRIGFKRPILPPSGLGMWNMQAMNTLLMPLLKAGAVSSELQEQ